MATATAPPPPRRSRLAAASRLRPHLSRLVSRRFTRELLILFAFTALTALMTWPWAAHLLNACADPGDPYLHSWVMWWDYHQTFHNPLHLFDGNIFYPLRWTLAFTEDDYGIALLFFPLYALGLRPLTVNSVATFFGFAFCGYGAFRLTRTLTGSNTAAWAAGVTFAFIPYRFHVLSQITYVFAGWMPLLLEALVLFARERTWKRAAWLGVAFTMNALSSLTWMTLSLVPLVLSALILIVSGRLWRDRAFWVRGAAAAAASLLVLLPFLLPYLYVSRLYGFTWPRELVENNSPTAWRWLVAEYRTRVWNGFGEDIPGPGARFFPGLLPLLLALASVIVVGPFRRRADASAEEAEGARSSKWVAPLDALAVAACSVVLVAAGWAGSAAHPVLGRIMACPTSDRALLVARVGRSRARRRGATLRAARRADDTHLRRGLPGRTHAPPERDADARRPRGTADRRRHTPAPLHAPRGGSRAAARQRRLDLRPAARLRDRETFAGDAHPARAARRDGESPDFLPRRPQPFDRAGAPPRLRDLPRRRHRRGPPALHTPLRRGRRPLRLVEDRAGRARRGAAAVRPDDARVVGAPARRPRQPGRHQRGPQPAALPPPLGRERRAAALRGVHEVRRGGRARRAPDLRRRAAARKPSGARRSAHAVGRVQVEVRRTRRRPVRRACGGERGPDARRRRARPAGGRFEGRARDARLRPAEGRRRPARGRRRARPVARRAALLRLPAPQPRRPARPRPERLQLLDRRSEEARRRRPVQGFLKLGRVPGEGRAASLERIVIEFTARLAAGSAGIPARLRARQREQAFC